MSNLSWSGLFSILPFKNVSTFSNFFFQLTALNCNVYVLWLIQSWVWKLSWFAMFVTCEDYWGTGCQLNRQERGRRLIWLIWRWRWRNWRRRTLRWKRGSPPSRMRTRCSDRYILFCIGFAMDLARTNLCTVWLFIILSNLFCTCYASSIMDTIMLSLFFIYWCTIRTETIVLYSQHSFYCCFSSWQCTKKICWLMDCILYCHGIWSYIWLQCFCLWQNAGHYQYYSSRVMQE